MRRQLTNKNRVKTFFGFLFLLIVAMILDCQLSYPDEMIFFEGESLTMESQSAFSLEVPVGESGVLTENGEFQADIYNQSLSMNQSGDYEMVLKLFGLVPVRTVTVDVLPKTELAVGGNTVGIKILSQGLVCVGTQTVRDKNGKQRDIAKELDIREGDIFLKVNEEELTHVERLETIVHQSGGQPIRFTISRNDKTLSREVTPIETAEGYRLGLWFRDSTAGIGTLTYYNPENLNFGALGHPITDADTNTLMQVSDGTLLGAKILSVEKGEKGSPGQLKGVFKTQAKELGNVRANTEQGIFGSLFQPISTQGVYPVASRNQVKEGRAQILSNVSEETVEIFDIEIQRNMGYHGSGGKDFVIHVTDPELLEKTGGIVQGMSGSPIIQNGNLIGAVTHVFVNDPTRGYGIFIENMLDEAMKVN